MNIPGYSKSLNLGHPHLAEMFDGTVVVQEKYDGSQISWAWDVDGKLHVRSRGGMQYGGETERTDPDGLFVKAIDHLLSVDPIPHLIFRGEAITAPRHNVLTYDRTPDGFIVLFDWQATAATPPCFETSLGTLADAMSVEVAADLGFTTVQPSMQDLDLWLERESSLGGVKVEGVVFKNYGKIGPHDNRTPLLGKYVSEAFREKKSKSDKAASRAGGIEGIITTYRTEARWQKAVQHLAEDGELEWSPRDIGKLLGAVKRELWEDEREAIDQAYRKMNDKAIERGVTGGFPEWYKRFLAERQLGG